MKTLKTQKGITLIALIITIIVMLILVGVSVNIALGNGLFKAAQSGARNTELEKQKETELSSGKVTVGGKTYSSIEDYVAGNPGVPAGVKVGDYVSYLGKSTWQVESITNGKVTIYTRLSQLGEYATVGEALTGFGLTYSSDLTATINDEFLNHFVNSTLAEKAEFGDYNSYLKMLTGKTVMNYSSSGDPTIGCDTNIYLNSAELQSLGLSGKTLGYNIVGTNGLFWYCEAKTPSCSQTDETDVLTTSLPTLRNGDACNSASCDALISVTLKNTVSFSGEGTASSPLTLSNS